MDYSRSESVTAVSLQPGEVHLWHCAIDEVPEQQLAAYRQLMSAEEYRRNQRFKFAKGRRAHAVTRALVRTVLSRYLPQRRPDQWQFVTGEHGKPEIANLPHTEAPLRFNLSHTDQRVVCGVALGDDVGVDIESLQRSNNVLSIADHYFSKAEVKALFALPEAEREDRFFDYWTLKEAYMKAHGQGISLGLGNFSFAIADDEAIAVRFADNLDDDPQQWQFQLFRHLPGHCMALAIRSGQALPLQVREFDLIPG